MGTACAMQIMSEALGLSLPGSAGLPATGDELLAIAGQAGERSVQLVRESLSPRKIVTAQFFENAILVHTAVSGPTNALLHLPAIALEFRINLGAHMFDRLHRYACFLTNIRPSGRWPAQYFHAAGGVLRIMQELRPFLYLDCMTVTGETFGDKLDALKQNGDYDRCEAHLEAIGPKRTEIIRSFHEPLGKNGAVGILYGTFAPGGAVVKHSAIPPEREITRILRERKEHRKPRPNRYSSGIMRFYTEHAVSPMKGGYME